MTIYRANMCFNNEVQHDTVDYIPSKDRVTKWDIASFSFSIVCHIAGFGLDLNLAYRYYAGADPAYFYATLGFILIPALINTAFSIRMYYLNKEKNKTLTSKFTKPRLFYVIILMFQLAPLFRHIDGLRYALKSRKAETIKDVQNQRKFYLLMVQEYSDVALLKVLECFLEAAPQQILQLAIIFHTHSNKNEDEPNIYIYFQLLSIGSSFVSMAWSMASYHRLIRVSLINKKNISWSGTATQFTWQLLVTVSRILCISVVASIHPYETVLALGIHWIIMVLWLHLSTKTLNFCNSNKFYEFLFYTVFGTVYIFTHIPISEGKTLLRYVFFYLILFVENLVGMIIWIIQASHIFKESLYFKPIIYINFSTFFVGILFMILYYKICHPSTGCVNKTVDSENENNS